MKKGIIKAISIFTAFVIFCSTPVSALSRSDANKFSANNILFYDPNGDICKTTPNGIFKGEQYVLTDEEIKGFARAAANENSCNLTALKSELSLMANLYEEHQNSYSSITDYLLNSGWFAGGTVDAFNNSSAAVSDEHIKAVKDVLINGNRVLPKEVLEHDCVGDLEWVELDGVKHYATNPGSCKGKGLEDKALYVANKTKIKNVYGSEYIFYQWAGGKESSCGDPFGYFEGAAPSESYSTMTGGNVNYAGAQVWSDAELQAIEENQPIYEEAANQYNFPWQVMAVLHSHETSLRRYNPGNGQGVYQLYSYTDGGTNANRFEPAESITEAEFRRQTIIAAEIVSGMVGDLNNPDNVKRLFFQYNGTADAYIQKAINMGFTEEQAKNGEGSAYVMNRYDAQRDPTSSSMSPLWPGRFVADGVYDPTSTSNGFGAFVQYEALAGSGSYCSSSGGTITETAILLSWEGHGHATTDPKPEYVAAMKEVGSWILPCGSDPNEPCPYYGASCDQFVATVMRYSGADPNFPIFHGSYTNKSGTDSGQNYYMDEHPEMYQKIDNLGNSSNLQPGDIFVVNNKGVGYHILLYIGEIDGQDSQASASWGGRTGEHFAGVPFSDYNQDYSIYRRINQ